MIEHMNKAEFSDLVGRSPRQVSNWISEGMPSTGTGRKGAPLRIDPAAAIQWLLNRTEQKNAAPLSEERRRLVAAQAEKAEIETAQRKGELLELNDVETLLIEGAAVFAGQKRSMGSRLAGKLAGMDDPKAILKLLNSENDRILQNVADKFSALTDLGAASSDS